MSLIQTASQHKHIVDAVVASTGIGAGIVALFGWLQPFAALFLTLASAYLVYLRIKIARLELKKDQNE